MAVEKAIGSSSLFDIIGRILDGVEDRVIDEHVSGRGVLMVLASTNRIDIIEPALLRSDRFDLLMELRAPDDKARLEIFKIHTRGKLIGQDIDFERLAGETDGMSGSDIELICRTASMSAIREHINLGAELKVTSRHFDEALQSVKERIEVLGE
jgi:transitional endoplasmic reticulum ATPase